MALLIFTMLMFNTMFIFLNHPMSMGVVLIVQTLLIALFSGLMLPSFWYSYILVLVFLGGLLILFVYVSSMASNEQISSLNPALFLMTFTFMSFPVIILIDSLPSKMMLSPDTESSPSPSYMWIFTSPSSSLALFLMIYLFIVLMAIVKITKFWGGSIRPLP